MGTDLLQQCVARAGAWPSLLAAFAWAWGFGVPARPRDLTD